MGKFRSGLEIHFQLNTKHKLFCNCSTACDEKEPAKTITRKQHPVASEMGELDKTAHYEFLRNRTFNYQLFRNETCLVEMDEEPPHPLNMEALETALQIAMLLKCDIPSEIEVMRKSVIDGSNPSSFQRTMIVGYNGSLDYKGRKIDITQVTLEEDAAAIVKEEDGNVTFRLNRLGVPLVEIDTGVMENLSPEDVQEIALTIGMTAKSTGKLRRGIGTIRQDVNISTKGERVELKGVQDLGMMAKVIEAEVGRQISLPKVEKETRAVDEEGNSRFIRPLPGAARMYPETDIPPVSVTKELLSTIRKNLPEPWTKKLQRFRKDHGLSDILANGILRSDYMDLFEDIVKSKKIDATLVANTFVSTLKDLRKREKVAVENLTDAHFREVFDLVSKGKMVKESVPEVLKALSSKPAWTAQHALESLGIKMVSEEELEKLVKDALSQPGIAADKAIGIVMSKVRGRVEAKKVVDLVKKMMKR
jgi:Glu-tRNA(Gln) amidotransferase subunit E-like FAD-binding protein